MFDQVALFNREVLGIEAPEVVELMDFDTRAHFTKCLDEELDEFVRAHDDSNIVGCVDAIVDLIYFALGGLHKMGLTSSQVNRVFMHVHDANMKKSLGKVAKRDHGVPDAVKPDDWVPPETYISEVIRRRG